MVPLPVKQALKRAMTTEDGAAIGPDVEVLEPVTKRRRKEVKAGPEIAIDVAAPEPPSKKAMRKAKKSSKLQPAAKDALVEAQVGADGTHEHAEAQTDGGGKATTRSKYGIWIGNLVFTVTKDSLRNFLTENTSIAAQQITRIHLPGASDATAGTSRPKGQPRNKGFAYVDLATAAALQEALTLSERLLMGRRVLIKDSTSFEGRPSPAPPEAGSVQTRAAGSRPANQRIFVGNLGFETTADELRQHYERCGTVADVHVATFEDSGKCKGYGWVEFDSIDAAAAAVRGWIMVKQEQEDAADESDAASHDRTEPAKSDGETPVVRQVPQKKAKMRKWWVNRFKGRPLRMEFAEDKATRYKKRFGKEASSKLRPESAEASDGLRGGAKEARQTTSLDRPSTAGRQLKSRSVGSSAGKPSGGISFLTGGIVESQGKRTVFDD